MKYVTNDGKEFTNLDAATAHEKELNSSNEARQKLYSKAAEIRKVAEPLIKNKDYRIVITDNSVTINYNKGVTTADKKATSEDTTSRFIKYINEFLSD